MKEWVKALYIGYHQELDLPKNLFPFPRTVQLKISLGPIRFLYSKFHGLLKLIFHTNQYNGALQQCHPYPEIMLVCYLSLSNALCNKYFAKYSAEYYADEQCASGQYQFEIYFG